MARIVQAVPKRLVDFATLPTLGTEDVILADKIDLPQSLEMTMLVRVHSHTLTSSSTISIMAMPELWTPEDPGKQFVAASPAGPPVVLDINTPIPGYSTRFLRTVGNNSIGPMTRILARGLRQASGTMAATLSVDICAKEGTSFLPTHLPNCVLWLHADDYNPVTGNWPDRSGKGNDGSQSSSSARPTRETNFNGLTDVLFDGATQYMPVNQNVATVLAGAQPQQPYCAVYLAQIVALPPSIGTFYGATLSSNASVFIFSRVWLTGGNYVDLQSRDDGTTLKQPQSTAVFAASTFYAVTDQFDGSTINVTVNGTNYINHADESALGSLTLDQFTLGARLSPGANSFLNMRLREFAIYTQSHSDTNVALVANGMRERAGLAPF